MLYDGKLEVNLPYKTNGYRPCPCQKIILACKTKPYMLQFFEKTDFIRTCPYYM